MDVQDQVEGYIADEPEPKRSDMRALHDVILRAMPGAELWFLDGRDESGKVVTNPSVGYGRYTIRYADGNIREFYQIGLSANTTGISVYVMGIEDRKYLPQTFGETIGKASVTGYCIKFKALKDVHLDVLEAAIRAGVEATSEG